MSLISFNPNKIIGFLNDYFYFSAIIKQWLHLLSHNNRQITKPKSLKVKINDKKNRKLDVIENNNGYLNRVLCEMFVRKMTFKRNLSPRSTQSLVWDTDQETMTYDSV